MKIKVGLDNFGQIKACLWQAHHFIYPVCLSYSSAPRFLSVRACVRAFVRRGYLKFRARVLWLFRILRRSNVTAATFPKGRVHFGDGAGVHSYCACAVLVGAVAEKKVVFVNEASNPTWSLKKKRNIIWVVRNKIWNVIEQSFGCTYMSSDADECKIYVYEQSVEQRRCIFLYVPLPPQKKKSINKKKIK